AFLAPRHVPHDKVLGAPPGHDLGVGGEGEGAVIILVKFAQPGNDLLASQVPQAEALVVIDVQAEELAVGAKRQGTKIDQVIRQLRLNFLPGGSLPQEVMERQEAAVRGEVEDVLEIWGTVVPLARPMELLAGSRVPEDKISCLVAGGSQFAS